MTTEDVWQLLKDMNVRVTFDPKRSLALPCVFCGTKGVRLVDLGRYANGDRFTRPVCETCEADVETWHRRCSECDGDGLGETCECCDYRYACQNCGGNGLEP